MEKYINGKANEIIEDLRSKMRSRGVELTDEGEYYLRVGMSYGLSLASFGLASLPADVTLGKGTGNNNETKIS